MTTRREELNQAVIEYFCNAITSGAIAKEFNLDEDKVSEILGQAQGEWDAVEIDADGANPEQEAELDAITEAVVAELLSL